MTRIAGVVVLYNPPLNVLDSINSYRTQVGTLFAVDNSEHPDQILVERVRSLENVFYTWNRDNLGIAKALNVGAELALQQQYDFLLMMDQDSVASTNLVAIFMEYLSRNSSTNIGILSPYHMYRNYSRPIESGKIKDILVAITAGTLLNLAVYKMVGPFMDELFIDYVDFEYCLRLKTQGFKVVQISDAILVQTLGNLVPRKILFRKVAATNHPPVRLYYRFRNRMFVVRKYFHRFPTWSIKELVLVGNELVKVLCFEDKKIEKCKMAFRGMVHSFFNDFGKYNEK